MSGERELIRNRLHAVAVVDDRGRQGKAQQLWLQSV